ncbi:hypothetical protein GALL_464930 [mine drainage metagenome]|uniref:DUF2127 domain-containing protein n=1 Tax=mine drainage metagenome TaxID=410659 RepID=A0A1J5PK47_9ZZZZ
MGTPNESTTSRLLHDSYLVGLGVQAAIGTFQLIGAAMIQIASRTGWLTGVATWTAAALDNHPVGVTGMVLHALHHFSTASDPFWSIYLIGHGVLNLGVVAALLAKKWWAHPVSILMLTGFIVYQLAHYMHNHSPILIALSLFDAVVIALVWREYRQLHPTAA